MLKTSAALVVVACTTSVGCSLTTDTAGLVDAAVTDASAPKEASVSDAGTDGVAANHPQCACPEGSEASAGGVCLVKSSSTHRTCTGPIVVPPCALSFQVEVCATDPKFAYDSSCSSASRQSAFFSFGDSPLGRWKVVASGVDTFARTDPECTQGVPPQCVKGPTATANLSSNGTTVAIGKLITAGCNTFSVKVDLTSEQN